MNTVRVIPLQKQVGFSTEALETVNCNGRVYVSTTAYYDVADNLADLGALESNGWIRVADSVGATSTRPTGVQHGHAHLDTTLGYVVAWNGTAWVNPATGGAV